MNKIIDLALYVLSLLSTRAARVLNARKMGIRHEKLVF